MENEPRSVTGYLLDEDCEWPVGARPFPSLPDMCVYNVNGLRILGLADFGVTLRDGLVVVSGRVQELWDEMLNELLLKEADVRNEGDEQDWVIFEDNCDPADFVVLLR